MAEEIMAKFSLERPETAQLLKSLEAQKGLALLKGTDRILMAWPFSAIASPFVVKLDNGKEYFANCAWDAVAFHVMLEAWVEIRSFCHHSGAKIEVRISSSGQAETDPTGVLVYLAKPANQWWVDIIDACSNTMVFFAGGRELEAWLSEVQAAASGVTLSIEQTILLSQPIYKGRMNLDYERTSAEEIRKHFAEMNLTGPFWDL